MIQNKLNVAKSKLKLHQERGVNSSLSIFEVAQLMDFIRTYENHTENNKHTIFFSFLDN